MTTGFRPPATRNFKHDPPTKVVAERFKPARRYRLEQILDALPDPPVAPAARTATLMAPGRGEDALLAIAPAQYVQALTGLRVGRDGKVRCPFHEDRTPSLHVYADPQRGWTCFGCGRGGSIFDLAAELDAITPRGAGFVALRERLEQRFGIAPTTRTARRPVQGAGAPVAAAGLSSSPSVAPQGGAVRAASPVHHPTGGASS